MAQENEIWNAIKDKVFFSNFNNVIADVVQEIPEQGEKDKVYFDGMTLLDCIEDVEDDIQQVSSITKDGKKVNLEDYYQRNGCYNEDGQQQFVDALNQLMTKVEYEQYLTEENIPLEERIKKFFENQDDYEEYTINEDGSVDVIGNIGIVKEDLIHGHLPFKFGKVKGWFDIDGCEILNTLWGSPDEVSDYYSFMDNQVTSLEWCPRKVGMFECTGNKIRSLKGCPSEIKGDFFCGENLLYTLEGCPEIINGVFNCHSNPLIINGLKDGPKEVSGDYICSDCYLSSLEGVPSRVGGSFDCSENELETLEGVPTEVRGDFICWRNPLKSLKGAPSKVSGNFDCSQDELETLEGAPKEVGGSFWCWQNQFKSLKGAPLKVGGEFECSQNKLETLEGAPREVGGDFNCSENELKSLEGAPTKIGGKLISDFDNE